VIGKYCRNVPESAALDHVWGVVPILDQTAEDILQRNPRFLARSKNFPTFFSFGPELVPLAEVRSALPEIEVRTVHNGAVHRRNTVSNMTFSPEFLVSFHSGNVVASDNHRLAGVTGFIWQFRHLHTRRKVSDRIRLQIEHHNIKLHTLEPP
jgi:hypothetical protein